MQKEELGRHPEHPETRKSVEEKRTPHISDGVLDNILTVEYLPGKAVENSWNKQSTQSTGKLEVSEVHSQTRLLWMMGNM